MSDSGQPFVSKYAACSTRLIGCVKGFLAVGAVLARMSKYISSMIGGGFVDLIVFP